MADKIDYSAYTGFATRSADLSELRDVMGRFRTKSLFIETIEPEQLEKGYKPIYTLREYDFDGLPSIWQIYMNSDTEYSAALKIVGSIRHWEKLTKAEWFRNPKPSEVGGVSVDGLDAWRSYKEEADRAIARATLVAAAQAGNIQAAKALLEAGDKKVDGRRKAEQPQEVRDTEEARVNHDFQLLTLIKNGST